MGMGMAVDIDQLFSEFISQLEKAAPLGVATLDSNAKVPKVQINGVLTASDVGAITAETDPTVASFTKGLTSNDSILTALNASSGTISASVLPSYVDDFLTFTNLAAFPVTGESGKIYLAENTNLSYRWTGSSYVDISSAGTADQAVKLATPRTISTTGDATYSVSFDGSDNVSGAITLANSGVSAGTYNALATQVRPLTVDAKGRITGVGTAVDITPPWSAITGTPTTLAGYGITNALPLSGGTVTGVTTFSNTTASTSTVTGGAVFGGGIGVAGNANIGGDINGVRIGIGLDNTSQKIGSNAGTLNTSGANWTAIGRNAGAVNTSSNWVAIGTNAANLNTTGLSWVSCGFSSGSSNLSGSGWVAVGSSAGGAISTGSQWTAIGANAGRFLPDGVTALTSSSNSCYIGMGTKGINSSTNENVFGYNATGNGSNTVTIGDNNIVRTYLKGVADISNTTPSTSPTTGASVIGGGQGIGGDQHVAGFSSLGGVSGGHPAIKIKMIIGTTAATQGALSSVAHGLTSSKIKSVSLLINPSAGVGIINSYTYNNGGYNAQIYFDTTNIHVINIAGESLNILSKPFTVLITYTE